MLVKMLPETSWGRQYFLTQEPVTFMYKDQNYYAPDQLKTDFSSVPRPLWFLINPVNWRSAPCATLHDKMCKECDTYKDRLLADRVFRSFLRARGIKWRLPFYYMGVRVGSNFWWMKRKSFKAVKYLFESISKEY